MCKTSVFSTHLFKPLKSLLKGEISVHIAVRKSTSKNLHDEMSCWTFHWLFVRSEREGRGTGGNHQDNSTKTTSLIPKFTPWRGGKHHDCTGKWGAILSFSEAEHAAQISYFTRLRDICMPPGGIRSGRKQGDHRRAFLGGFNCLCYPLTNSAAIRRVHPAYPCPGLR